MADEKTLTFKESGGRTQDRWSSFYSYMPEMMVGLNNAFFSFKNGELYEHDLGAQNTFYEVYTPSQVVVIFNDMPSDDKVYHSMHLEGTDAWDIALETNMMESSITEAEFVQKESRWFAYTRRYSNALDFKSLATVGIGIAQAVNSTTITFTAVNERTSVGDKLYQIQSNSPIEIGTIASKTGTTITVASLTNSPAVSGFCFSLKDARREGSKLRGYYMSAELTSNKTSEVELFAINATISKSHV